MAKNFLEKTVRFNIQRKPALADSLLPYKIYINGQYVGALKNGRTISAEVPRAEIYYIDVDLLNKMQLFATKTKQNIILC